jgi:hypothetical protein
MGKRAIRTRVRARLFVFAPDPYGSHSRRPVFSDAGTLRRHFGLVQRVVSALMQHLAVCTGHQCHASMTALGGVRPTASTRWPL